MNVKQTNDRFYSVTWLSTARDPFNIGGLVQDLLLQMLLAPLSYKSIERPVYQENRTAGERPESGAPVKDPNMVDTIVYEVDDHIKIQIDIPPNVRMQNLQIMHEDDQLIIKGWPDGYDKIIRLEGNPPVEQGTAAVNGRTLEITIPKNTA